MVKYTFVLKPMTFARGSHVAKDIKSDVAHIFAIGRSNNPKWTLQNGSDTYTMDLAYSQCTTWYNYVSKAVGKNDDVWEFRFEHGKTRSARLTLEGITISGSTAQGRKSVALELQGDVAISFEK